MVAGGSSLELLNLLYKPSLLFDSKYKSARNMFTDSNLRINIIRVTYTPNAF